MKINTFLYQGLIPFVILILNALVKNSRGCKEGNKEVGVCLHVYLERDFLALEKIVYPSQHRYKRSFNQHESAKPNRDIETKLPEEEKNGVPENYEVDNYDDRHYWIEGPELEDHCKRLKEVLRCFEDVLIDCDSGYHFFRYRHLLYALSGAHTFLCSTPDVRKDRFLEFLKTIKCAEEARRSEISCHRHNVSSVVWNKILRVEVGEEICDSLSTQRACLIENKYIHKHCRNTKRIQLYEDFSNYFLSLWCRYPLHPKLYNMMTHSTLRITKSSSSYTISRISTCIPVVLVLYYSYLINKF